MAKSAINPERHAAVPQFFRGIPKDIKFPYPGPVKQALRDINYIKQLNTIPCGEASWWVIAETFAQTAPPALLSLFVPGCTDIIKAKLGLSPWHSRGLSGLIRKAAPPLAVNGTKFLYNIGYFTAEKYLWFFQLAEVTKEFFITWQSQIFMQQQCQLPGAGTAYGYITPFVYPKKGTGPLSITPVKLCPGIAVGPNSIQVSPGFQASIAWSAEWASYPDRSVPANVWTWDKETDIPETLDFMNTYDPALNNKSGTGGHQYIQNPSAFAGKTLGLYWESDSELNVQPISGTWTASVQGRHSGLYSFGCYPKAATWPFPNPFG